MDDTKISDMVIIVLFLALVLFSLKSCHEKDKEIGQLNSTVEELNATREADLHERCMDAVDRTCNLTECSTNSIEEIQEDVCRRLEDK